MTDHVCARLHKAQGEDTAYSEDELSWKLYLASVVPEDDTTLMLLLPLAFSRSALWSPLLLLKTSMQENSSLV